MTTTPTPPPGELAGFRSENTGRTFFGIVTAEDGDENDSVVLKSVFHVSDNDGKSRPAGHDRWECPTADLLDLTDPEVRDQYLYEIGLVLDLVGFDVQAAEEDLLAAQEAAAEAHEVHGVILGWLDA